MLCFFFFILYQGISMESSLNGISHTFSEDARTVFIRTMQLGIQYSYEIRIDVLVRAILRHVKYYYKTWATAENV